MKLRFFESRVGKNVPKRIKNRKIFEKVEKVGECVGNGSNRSKMDKITFWTIPDTSPIDFGLFDQKSYFWASRGTSLGKNMDFWSKCPKSVGEVSGMVQNVLKLIFITFWTIPDTSPPILGILTKKIHF